MLVTRTAIQARLPAMLMTVSLLAAPVRATENVLELLPEKTLGFVLIDGLADANSKLGKHAQELDLPLPDLLALAKASAGIKQGLNDAGSLLAAVVSSVDGSERIEDSEGLVALPVTDYRQFVGQFDGDASSEITELTVAGLPMLVAERSGYAVLVPADSEHRSLLREVLEQDPKLPPEIDLWDEWIAANDVAMVVLAPGIKLVTARGIAELEKIKEQFAGMPELGAQAGQIAAAFDMYCQMLQVIQAEVHTAANGLQIDEMGNIRLGGRVRFTEGGQLAQIGDTPNRSIEDLLAGLPGGPFAGAFGASLSPECGQLVTKWSIALMKNNPALYGMELSDEAADRYFQLTLASMEGFRGFSMMMAPSAPGAAILDGMFGVIVTDDTAAYLATYERAMGQFQQLIEESGSGFPYKFALAKATIAGVEGLNVAMDLSAALMGQGGPPEAAQILERMFGPDGKLTAHLLAIDRNRVLFSYGSVETIELQIAALQDDAPGLAQEASIQATTALLPNNAGFVAYLSPRGAVAWLKNIVTHVVPQNALAAMPDVPATPAVGFSAKLGAGTLETELVVPAELLKVAKEYLERVKQ